MSETHELTTKELRDGFERMFSDWKDIQLEGLHKIQTHIAALTAERDELRTTLDAYKQVLSNQSLPWVLVFNNRVDQILSGLHTPPTE
jgi:hypothetical protein